MKQLKETKETKLYGLLAEFEYPQDLVDAARHARDAGYRRMEAYTPFSVEGLAEIIGVRRPWIPYIVLGGGIAGALIGFLMQYYAAAISYPLNIGGRPLDSWPAFIPVTFELAVLCAALAGAFGMLALNGLPHPSHPIFNVKRFELATQSRFFLCIEARDPKFEQAETRRFLQTLQPHEVFDVGE